MAGDSDRRLETSNPIRPADVLRLRLDIGRLSPESHVEKPVVLPPLPEDIWLDVMVSSSHFLVAKDPEELNGSRLAHDRFLLPKGGGPAKAEDGMKYVFVFLQAPPDSGRLATARINYYYRNSVIQSQLIEAAIGGDFESLGMESRGCFRISTDFTTSETFAALESIPENRCLSIMTNHNGGGRHQFVVRQAMPDGKQLAADSIELDESTWGDWLRDIRKQLRTRAPTRRKRSRAQLIEDLWQLAPLGWQLNANIAGQLGKLLDAPFRDPDNLVIQVCRPKTATFTMPWGLLYEIHLDSDAIKRRRLKVCPLVEEWNGKRPLVDHLTRSCPAVDNGQHDENTLCPFGFWGFRYSVEQLSSSRQYVLEIESPEEFTMVAGETRYEVRRKDLDSHVNRLRDLVRQRFSLGKVERGSSKQQIRSLLGRDLPVVYFYCHGERPKPGDPSTYLGVGQGESIAATDFVGWVDTWRRKESKVVWDKLRPLIFVNACHSLEINPDTLVSYLDAFIGAANAAGVVGTEVKVNQELAMDFAELFFQFVLLEGKSVDDALRRVRFDYLRAGNLFGLVYTPHCWANLTFT
ncbi:MAG: hypothetical protein HKM89_15385 [Gemmatimonadales bacterium]|nr:hypothetical protein [Gemmatimonadales bacterium]